MAGQFQFADEVERFTKIFAAFRDKRVVLYGTGRMTATLLQGLTGFQIVGVCDRDRELAGTMMYGLPVLTQKEAEEQADILVINTGESYWTTIYKRIQGWRLPIYFTNGQRAKLPHTNERKFPHWKKSYAELRRVIRAHDMISFDIFDTLVMRKVFLPIDVYRIMEERLDKQTGKKTHFQEIRQRASRLLANPTLSEIYDKMAALLGKPRAEMDAWQAMELETDKALLVGREDMIRLCRETMAEKPVFLISDMHYESDVLQELLAQCGLSVRREQILVSCEQKMAKTDHDWWPHYKKNYVGDKKALHIGDDRNADILRAEACGITAYQVMSAMELWEHSSVKDILPSVSSLYSSLTMGLLGAQIFNSPFSLNATKGTIRFDSEKEAGFCMMGALLESFSAWLWKMTQEKKIHTLLFFGRDGYLLRPLYEHFILSRKRKSEYGKKSIYLEISRSAVWSAAIFDEADIYEIAAFPFTGTFREFLAERYDVTIDVAAEGAERSVSDLQKKPGVLNRQLAVYKENIIKQSANERKAYRHYFDSLGEKKHFAVVDTMFHGTIQQYLSRILQQRLEGFYLCVYTGKDNPCLQNNVMYSCLKGTEGTDDTAVRSCFSYRRGEFMDAFFTSPEGMLKYIRADNQMVRAPQMTNQKNFSIREDMAEGIRCFMDQMREMEEVLGIELSRDADWADMLFGYFMDGGFQPSERMARAFFFDDQVMTRREMAVWEGLTSTYEEPDD